MKPLFQTLTLLLAVVFAGPAFAAQQPSAPGAAEASATMLSKSEIRKMVRDQKKAQPAEMGQTQLLAGIMGIVLGAFGVHKFILGYKSTGLLMLLLTVLTLGILGGVMGIIGLIEGIIYLTKTPEDFQATYIDGEKRWF